MEKIYVDAPYNFSQIETYVITDINAAVREIILAEKCYFYDTCSFRNHMSAANVHLLYEYIKSTSGIVILPRTIIMELCSNDGMLWNEHIQYIKNMYQAGIKILVLYEEDFFEVLHTYCADVTGINKWLSYAVRSAKSKVGSVERAVGQDVWLKKMLFEAGTCKESKLAERMFSAARKCKVAGDNLGEEMIAVCVHWLSHIRESVSYKYIIFSDDKKAMTTFGRVIKNSKDFLGSDMISVVTTAKLCYLMQVKGIVSKEEQVIGLLSKSSMGDNISSCCSEEFELAPAEKTMSIEEFARKIIEGNIKVYF